MCGFGALLEQRSNRDCLFVWGLINLKHWLGVCGRSLGQHHSCTTNISDLAQIVPPWDYLCNLMTSCINLVGVASQTIFTSTFCSIAHLYVIASEFVCSRARARVCVCVCVCERCYFDEPFCRMRVLCACVSPVPPRVCGLRASALRVSACATVCLHCSHNSACVDVCCRDLCEAARWWTWASRATTFQQSCTSSPKLGLFVQCINLVA